MGLANLKYINQIHEKRRALSRLYDEKLKTLKAIKPLWHSKATENFPYYPIVLESEELLLKLKKEMDSQEIFTRRYFYPSLASALPYLPKLELSITEDIAKRSLCLPFYYDMTFEEVEFIARLMLRIQNN
ncbi:putative aminotransferase [Chryseobacterium indologenes NBRC 14944]|nr:putative aminotransferase [Chryseobacterium indologenes NBRC 14944]